MKNKLFLLSAMLFLTFAFGTQNLSAQTENTNSADKKPTEMKEKPQTETKPQTGNTDYQNASTIFVGEVVSAAEGSAKFAVKKSWKGKNVKEMKVAAAKTGGNCVEFKTGTTYLVYLTDKKEVNCEKTKEVGAVN